MSAPRPAQLGGPARLHRHEPAECSPRAPPPRPSPSPSVPGSVDTDGLQQARTIFVLAFFMIWNFVLSNIFVGLIASAFEAIRDDHNTITSDRLSKCLICSQDMYLFNEKIEGGFDEHILRQHNALHYVFFLHHLRATALEEYTGAESIVSTVLDNAKTTTDKGTWLPVSKSLAIMHATAASASKEGGSGAQ
ncbi:Ryanodine receptor 1 [Tetrabaena socialis]|uniref:Ryanodine receptor 1 n=1 Tax=Tetrabaena socialis TaxID=47790 RepID=A0A2J7ZJH0_9CHLO|nr:Ryanodine receptor 1 [Tetrabaena socialis]|eukprot:PNH00400.1 Ryanodine receptor 1 [Tetrabaena socialis]